MTYPATVFDLANVPPETATISILPLPFEGSVSYGTGTAAAPAAISRATAQVELYDEETGFDLDTIKWHLAAAIQPVNCDIASYLDRVEGAARSLHASDSLVIGLGGEHSLTPPLVRAAAGERMNNITVVQFDAHADLRDEYEGSRYSHACAMRRLVENGARAVGIGIRALSREEAELAATSPEVDLFYAHDIDDRLVNEHLSRLTGDVYLTIDLDVFEVALCPGTGTPEPGGLTWRQVTLYLRTLLSNPAINLIGADLVEAVPQPNTQINEFVAARLLGKIAAYYYSEARK